MDRLRGLDRDRHVMLDRSGSQIYLTFGGEYEKLGKVLYTRMFDFAAGNPITVRSRRAGSEVKGAERRSVPLTERP